MTKQNNLTNQEQEQVIKAVQEMVLEMNYEELIEEVSSYMEQYYLSRPKDFLVDCGFINNQPENN